MWIYRDLTHVWEEQSAQPIRILLGPRQSGKTSFLEHLAHPSRKFVNFDDLPTRDLASRDPKAFLDNLPNQLVIDEAQYVPVLFPEIKRRVDQYKKSMISKNSRDRDIVPPSFWLTGSNRLALDRQVSESLTGRASFFLMNTLSFSEIKQSVNEATWAQYLLKGGWPELWTHNNLSIVSYLNDHIQTTLEKDLVYTAGITKVNEFLKVLRLLAGRVGGLFVASEISRDAGVKSDTVADWVSFIERMMYLIHVPAYATSLSTRLIKAPRYYFADIGIATRLQGWTSAEPIMVSPYLGSLFENAVASEIFKTKINGQLQLDLFHWRTKDNEEVDFVVEHEKGVIGFECKYAGTEAASWIPPKAIRKLPHCEFVVVSLTGGPSSQGVEHISLEQIAGFLKNKIGFKST